MAKQPAMCKKGKHKMTRENTYQHPAKGPECRECKRVYMKSYMRKLRAKTTSKSKRRRSA